SALQVPVIPSLSPSVSLRFLSSPPHPSEISTLSLHDALPISTATRAPGTSAIATCWDMPPGSGWLSCCRGARRRRALSRPFHGRSEEHTSELQSRENLVCRLPLEKKNSSQGCTLTARCRKVTW